MSRREGAASAPIKMTDVAEAAKVSRATVSLVMTESPLVAEKTRQRVLKAAADLGYVYNRSAVSFRNQRTNIIGLVVTDLRNPFFGEIAATIQQFMAAEGYFVVMVNTMDDMEQQNKALQEAVEQRFDGILLVPCPGTDPEVIEKISERVSVVLLTRSLSGSRVPFVGSEDYEGGAAAAEHLIARHGCRSLGFFGGASGPSAREERLRGFTDAVRRAGAIHDETWQEAHDVLAAQSYSAFRHLLEHHRPPEGLVCNSDNIAYGAMRALRDSGYPDVADCRVIGFDDVEQSALWSPSLTSVAVSPAELGKSAGSLMLRLLRGNVDGAPEIRHPARLMARESCGC